MPARQQSLGSQIAEFNSRPLSRRGFQVGLVAGVLAVLVPLAYGYSRAQYAHAKYGPVAAQFWSRPWYLLSALAGMLLLLLLLLVWVYSKRSITVHKNGLRLRLSRRKQYTWGELSGISTGVVQTRLFGIPLRTDYQAVLYPHLSAPVRLDNTLVGLPELLTRIKANLYPRLLPGLRQDFQDGKRLYFGALAVQKQELLLPGSGRSLRAIPWSQVRSVSVQAGMLQIELEGERRVRLPAAHIPNLELLLQIIQSGVTE